MKFALSLLFFAVLCFAKCKSQQYGDSGAVYTYKTGSADGIGKWYMGREIAAIMSASGAAWLQRNEREKEENTELAIKNMKLKSTDVIADIGAGSGYYTFKLSKLVAGGKVYAVDIQDEMLKLLNDRQKQTKADNVVIIKGTDSSVNLPDNSIDVAIMVDVYHELEFPHEILQSIRKALKINGKLLLIEYRGEDASVPIKPLHKTTVAQDNKELAANGYTLIYNGEFLPLQHFLMYGKQ